MSILICLADDLTDHGPFSGIFRDFRRPEPARDWLGVPTESPGEEAG